MKPKFNGEMSTGFSSKRRKNAFFKQGREKLKNIQKIGVELKKKACWNHKRTIVITITEYLNNWKLKNRDSNKLWRLQHIIIAYFPWKYKPTTTICK